MQDQDFDARSELMKKWQLAVPEDEDAPNEQELLLRALKRRVLYLLEHNFDKLINALYRLDAPEQATQQAFGLRKPDAVAEALSHIILARELQKMRSRYQRQQELDRSGQQIKSGES